MKNNFAFEDQHYLQVYSTAIATPYANLFMGNLEDRLQASTVN